MADHPADAIPPRFERFDRGCGVNSDARVTAAAGETYSECAARRRSSCRGSAHHPSRPPRRRCQSARTVVPGGADAREPAAPARHVKSRSAMSQLTAPPASEHTTSSAPSATPTQARRRAVSPRAGRRAPPHAQIPGGGNCARRTPRRDLAITDTPSTAVSPKSAIPPARTSVARCARAPRGSVCASV